MEHQRPISDNELGEMPYLRRELVEEHLAVLSVLDRGALLNTLVPHRTLPDEDVGGYIIKNSQQTTKPSTEFDIRTAYDLGVVFARSLMIKIARRDGSYLLPIIGKEDVQKKELIDTYLSEARRTPITKLISYDSSLSPYLEQAIGLFYKKCEVTIPDKVLDGPEVLRRGIHDYFSVISLIEAEGREQQARRLSRRLGKNVLSSMFGRLFGRSHGRQTAA